MKVPGRFFALLLAAAVSAVAAQLEGRALGGVTGAHILTAAAHLDLFQGAALGLAIVIRTAIHGAADAGVGIFSGHLEIPPDIHLIEPTLSMPGACKVIRGFLPMGGKIYCGYPFRSDYLDSPRDTSSPQGESQGRAYQYKR